MNYLVPRFGLRVVWQSLTYDPAHAQGSKRFVRQTCAGLFVYCIMDKDGWDIQQGEANPKCIPQQVKEQASQGKGHAFSWVEWPVSIKADYDYLNFWCQGWMSKLNHVIRLRNHSFNDKERGRLDVRINQLRARYDAARKRRQPVADALLKSGE